MKIWWIVKRDHVVHVKILTSFYIQIAMVVNYNE